MTGWRGIAGGLAAVLGLGCSAPAIPDEDPRAFAIARRGLVDNLEAAIPPACYAETGAANRCWTCHSGGFGPNTLDDADLQAAYDFSDEGAENRWHNLFEAPRAGLDEAELLRWVRQDNYGALIDALAADPEHRGLPLDLDLAAGFDDDGFARDGSGWRAVRYQPFPGFWPDTGSIGDVFVRLPDTFRRDATGVPSREVYRQNLAILEAAIAGVTDPGAVRLPAHYVGGAREVPVEALVYPLGAELLHSVRYVDPDAPDLMSARMKELRWMRKEEAPDAWARLRAYEREADEKEEGLPPRYRGDALEGLVNAFGWRMQGFIEDEAGRLRLQSDEEHRFCMGCHQGLGVTVDSTFSLARKVPGDAGWRPQDLRGLTDRPQVGHTDGELATFHARAGLPAPAPAEILLAPERADALAMIDAYRALVAAQSYRHGRDATVAPRTDLHRRVTPGQAAAATVHRDGRLHLIW